MKTGASYSNQRVGIFVHVQNLYHSAKNIYRGRVNYAELIKNLLGDRQLIRAMAYVVKSEGVEPQRSERAENRGQRTDAKPRRNPLGVDQGREEKSDLSTEAAFFEALEKAGLELRMKD